MSLLNNKIIDLFIQKNNKCKKNKIKQNKKDYTLISNKL